VELYRHSPHTYACLGAELSTGRTLYLEAVEQLEILCVLTNNNNSNNDDDDNNNSEWIEVPTPIFGSQ
jgi:hypothetical protein